MSLLFRFCLAEMNRKVEGSALFRMYGVLKGVFDIKRELRPLETAQLKQSIVTLETALNDEENKELNIPRLINRYFWLIDFYDIIGNDSGARENTLKKIRDLNPAVYELYSN